MSARSESEGARGKDWKHEAYLDLARPLASEIGEVAGELVSLALLPVRGSLWGVDKVIAALGGPLKRALGPVKGERLKAPESAIAVPLFQAMAYTGHEEPLTQMFANLLASSMDQESVRYAHPSFVTILKELVPGEARMLALLRPSLHYKTALRFEMINPGGGASSHSFSLLQTSVKSDSVHSRTYLINLKRAGLLNVEDEEEVCVAEQVSQHGIDYLQKLTSRLESCNLELDITVMRECAAHFIEHIVDRNDSSETAKKTEAARVFKCVFTQRAKLTEFGEMMHFACVRGPA